MSSFIIIKPSIAIQDYVEYFWETEWNNISSDHAHYLAKANTGVQLIFVFRRDIQGGVVPLYSSIQGQRGQYSWLPVPKEGQFHIFGIRLFPHTLPLLYDVPPACIKEQMLASGELSSKQMHFLSEQLSTAKTFIEKIQLFTVYLVGKLSKIRKEDTFIIKALREIDKRRNNFDISVLARDFNLSEKQFGRRFKEATGFNPKLYSSIRRFEQAIMQYPKAVSLTALAYNNEYYDQAHFIHDFKKYTGVSPLRYFRQGFL